MRVLIDARSIGNKLTGVGRHTLNLLLGLSYVESDLEFFVLINSPKAHKVIDRSGGPFRHRFFWIQSGMSKIGLGKSSIADFEIPVLLKTHRIDLFHDTSCSGSMTFNVPFVTTIHELEGLHKEHSQKYRDDIRKKIKGVRLLIAVSKTLANDIDQILHISMPQIRIIQNAIDPWYIEPVSQEEIKATRERFKLAGKYYLCVTSMIRKSKNADFLLDFAEKSSNNRHWLFTLPKIREKSSAVFLDLIDDVWLRPLYAESTAVIVPSTYEGFSLPPLEALATGTLPVVSDIAAHHEVLDEILPQGLFFSPNSFESLNFALQKIDEGGEPLRSSVLEKFKQVRDRYSFIETARKVHAVYKEAMGR